MPETRDPLARHERGAFGVTDDSEGVIAADSKRRRDATAADRRGVCYAMARLAIACIVAAACGDNLAPAPLCSDVTTTFAHRVPLRTLARALPDGAVQLAGTFSGTVMIGDVMLASAGGTDIFLARIAADGAITARAFGDEADQELQLLATNAAGDVAIAGRFRGGLDLGSDPPLIATGSTSSFYLARFDHGGLAFARAFTVEAILRALALSPRGDVALAGSNFDPIEFGGGVLPTGGQFLGVVDGRGAYITSRPLATENLSVNLDVGLAFDDADELLVAGSFTQTIDLGGAPLASAGGLDLYLARYAAGAHRASRRLGNAGNDGYRGFDGDRIVVAPIAGGVILGAGTQSPVEDTDDMSLVRFDGELATTWTRPFPYPSFQAIGALAVGDAVAITGISSGATDPSLPGACGSDASSSAFAATFDPADGRPRWSACFPAGEFSAGLSIAWRSVDELVVAGTFDGALEIGSAQLVSEGLGGFVAGLRPSCD